MTLSDPEHLEALAVAVRGQSFELAGTAMVAIAVAVTLALDIPLDHGHSSAGLPDIIEAFPELPIHEDWAFSLSLSIFVLHGDG
jgi:hypothetical protein